MHMVAKLDDIGKPAWIALTAVSFIIWWPIGLAALAFTIGSGRMGCGCHSHTGWREHRERWRAMRSEWRAMKWGGYGAAPSTGNAAFDEYRNETLKRLEDEQKEFWGFLDRLRRAKDKAEFDQFMTERRNAPPEEPSKN
jgi:Protein of unknown function (DUF2852)